MKKHCFIFLFAIIGMSLNAQEPFRIKVVDSKTTEGIAKALVFIEEIPVPDQETDAFGLVTYQNVPQDRKVRLNVRKKGYLPQQVEIVASKEIKVDNNIVIKLEKESSIPQVTIYGEVTDKNDEEIEGASVEVTILGKPYSDVTDASGNYQIRIDGSNLKSIPSFQIEAKKKDCERIKSTEAVLQSNYINKDFKLECGTTKSSEETKQGKSPSPSSKILAEKNQNSTKLSIEKFEQKGTVITFYFTLENLTPSTPIRESTIHGHQGEFIDQNGAMFQSINVSVGNIEGTNYVKIKLVYGTPVKGFIQFDVGAVKITKASLLRMSLEYIGVFEFINLVP